MNRVYRLVWNRTRCVLQVASELAHAPRDGMGVTAGPTPTRHRQLVLACAMALGLAANSASVHAQSVTGTAGGDGAAGGAPTTDPGGNAVPGTGGAGGAGSGAGNSGGGGGTATTTTANGYTYTTQTPGSAGQGNPATSAGGGGFQGYGDAANGGTSIGGGAGGHGSGYSGGGGAGGGWDTAGVGGGGGGGGSSIRPDGSYGGGGGGGGGGLGQFISASQTVTGTVSGGQGGAGGYGEASDGGGGGGGGAGAYLGSGSNLTNNGTISGGAGGGGGSSSLAALFSNGSGGGGGGGGGVLMSASSSLTNNRIINGGNGGNGGIGVNGVSITFGVPGGFGGIGGNGGVGVFMNASGSLANSGSISGGSAGAGGNGGDGSYGEPGGNGSNGGNGGVGVVMGASSSLTNSGNIRGGTGGASGVGGAGSNGQANGSDGTGGAGGVGIVVVGNNTVINSGSISGGQANGGSGAQADAIDLSGGGNMLTLENGYSFTGNVVSTSGGSNGGDTLVLGGDTNSATPFNVSDIVATLPASFTGTQYVGFQNFIKTGASTWILTGSSGENWTIVNGTLQGDVTTFQGSLTFNPGAGNNAGVTFDQGSGNSNSPASATYAGSITGNGSVTKIDDGVLTLTGVNAYTGKTTISAGTLALSGSGSIASSSDVVVNGSFDISNTASGVTIQQLDGSGSVALGNQALTIGSTGASNQGTFSGVISGGGNLTLAGGTQTLGGVNTYTGSTTINAGTLALSGNGSIASSSDVIVNSAFDISGTTSGATIRQLDGSGSVALGNQMLTIGSTGASNQGTFGGLISGAGSLTLAGGTETLNGVSTYTGGTIISAGTLAIGDSDHASAAIAGPVDVQTSGTLRGHGSINGNVINDGIVWPGGSVGVLTINGSYTQNPGGTLQIDVTPTQASELLVNGNVALAGILSLTYAPGTYSPTTYTLVQSTARNGTFATTNSFGSIPTALNPTVVYNDTQVDLVLASSTSTTPPPPPTRIAPRGGALYGNLQRTTSLSSQQTLIRVLDASLDLGCGEGEQVQAAHLTQQTCKPGLWMQYTGSALHLDGANGINSTGFSLLGGADVALGDVAHLGAEAGVGLINANDSLGGHSHADNVHGGLYAFANAGPVVLSATADVMHSSYRVDRNTGIGQAVVHPDGQTLSAGLQAAWPIQLAQWQLAPKLGVLYQHQALDSFRESITSSNPLASAFAVDGAHSTYNSLQPYVAFSFTRAFNAGQVTYIPALELGYRYDTRAVVPTVSLISQDGTVFAMPGAALGRGLGTVGARITAQQGNSWSAYVDYKGLFANHLNDNSLSVGFIKYF